MPIKITDDCINCGACEPECPNNAIYEGGMEWKFSDGTNLSGKIKIGKNNILDADVSHPPKKNDIFFIVSNKCTECIGVYDEPQCASVCPVDCCIPDQNNIESKEYLLNKKKFLHKD